MESVVRNDLVSGAGEITERVRNSLKKSSNSKNESFS
jgi:hypothetical protein